MDNNIKYKLLNSPEWVVSVLVFISYWMANKPYTGPIILDDEIGYLANAALISGHIIDGANSWHAGYSFFIAPLFLIFTEPESIWRAIMVLNAFIWSITFLLLAYILKSLMPRLNNRELFIVLIVAAVYPAWITMSGYVFATTAFVFVYLLSIIALLLWNPNKFWTILPHCILIGYLYWIHPVGLAVCVASLIVVGFVSIKNTKYASMIFSFILILAMIAIYREIIDKWLILQSTPVGFEPLSQHYPGSERFVGRLISFDFWMQVIARTAGQISYVIISSLGLIFFGLVASINNSYKIIRKSNSYHSIIHHSTFAYMVLSFLGVLAMGVMFFSAGSSNRVDHWIYGRYIEMVVLPLLAIGYISVWRKNILVFAAIFVFLTGIFLNYYVDMSDINLIFNTVSFWPQYLISHENYFYWLAAGSLLLIILGAVKSQAKPSKIGNMLVVASLVLIFLTSSVFQGFIHYNSFKAYGKPSTLVGIVRKYYPQGTCVGINPSGLDQMKDLRFYKHPLHLFYLYDYTYHRISPGEWLEHCEGPYFTYDIDELYEEEGVRIAGKEVLSGIYLLAKDNGSAFILPEIIDPANDIYVADGRTMQYRLSYAGNQLTDMAGPAGYYENGSIYSNNVEGYLLLSPHLQVGPGEYEITLTGNSLIHNNSWVDIVSERNEIEYANIKLVNNQGSNDEVIVSERFVLNEPVYDLLVRVNVTANDEIRIDGFEFLYLGAVDK